MSDETNQNVTKGEGYAVANLADLGEGPGFRKIRKELGVTAFGVNAIVLPPTYETGSHFHDEQEELYFVHSGEIEFTFGDGSTQRLRPRRPRLGRRSHLPQSKKRQRLRRGRLRDRRRQGRLCREGRETGRGRDAPVDRARL